MRAPDTAGTLLPVPLDRVRVANLRLIWISSRVAQRTALTEQVPAPVELDLDLLEPPLVIRELLDVVGV
jgi:hypothetical protein